MRKAFNVFDADNDGKLTIDEFEFFMTSFAKQHNGLRDGKLIEEMLAVARPKSVDDKFVIEEAITGLQKAWKRVWLKFNNLSYNNKI